MKLSRTNITLISIICIAILLCGFAMPTGKIFADTPIADGTYEAPIDINIKMGEESFAKSVLIEKLGDNYYMTFTVVDSSNLANLEILLGGKVGVMTTKSGKTRKYTYTLTHDDLLRTIRFSVVVTAAGMNKRVEFSIKVKMDGLKKKKDTIEDRGERPAHFLPVITTNASDAEVEKGTNYIVPLATAVLGKESVPVTTKAYYMIDGKRVPESIVDGKLRCDKVGEYQIVYRAESDKYKTSLGKNTSTEYVVTLKSKVGASTIGKMEDINGILPANSALQANYVTFGKTFNKAKNAMAKIADNFTVYDITVYGEAGDIIKPTKQVRYYLMANELYNRQEIVVYHMAENGTLTKIPTSNYGRYVSFNTTKTGTFIVCVPGVAFHMPIWGYVLIAVAVLIVLAIAITLTIVLVRRHKRVLVQDEDNDPVEDNHKD